MNVENENTEDTAGHMPFRGADAEQSDSGADTEGHRIGRADAEQVEGTDDAAGHMPFKYGDAEQTEEDDAAGHGKRWPLDTQRTEE